MVAAPPKSQVTDYAEAVVAGRILTGRLVRLSAERHLRDLKTGHERGLVWREDKAQHAINFIGELTLFEAQKPFKLEPWQAFIVGALFGWYFSNGMRRFTQAYIEVARSNGKTPLLAAIGIYCQVALGVHGAQVFSAATTRDQAKILFKDAVGMVNAQPYLAQGMSRMVNVMEYRKLGSVFRPLSSDASKMDGLRVLAALVDEVHEHPSAEVITKLRTGMGKFAGHASLLCMITTAGFNRETVCYEQHDYGTKIVEGLVNDETYFSYIATIDAEDDWTDETVWCKPNPNLGVSIQIDTLRQECEQAKAMPGQQNPFKRLRLNVWTQQANRWVDVDTWNACRQDFTEADMEGEDCYAGLDLSSTLDITALALYFTVTKRRLYYYWVPEERIDERSQRDRVPYRQWVDDGHIFATPGNVVDYDVIRAFISGIGTDGKKVVAPALVDRFHIKALAKDRWNSTQLGTQLMGDGVNVIDFSQGFAAMAAPAREYERQIVKGEAAHNGNPVEAWMVSNLTVEQDASGNIKPSKAKSTEKIDGPVAELMALGTALLEETDHSVIDGEVFWL